MTTQKDIEQAIREALHKCNIPIPEQDFVLNMCSSLMATASENSGLGDNTKFIEDASFDLLSKQQILTLLRQQSAELDTLKKLSLHLSSSLNLKTVLNAIATDARALHRNTRTVHIFLYNAQSDALTFGSALDEYGLKDESYAAPRPNGLTHQVARSGEMIIVQDMQTHSIYENAPKAWTGSIVGIPLKINQEVVGVMNISRSSTGEFVPSELKLLAMLADHAALAISNACLHDQVSKQAKRDTMTGLPNRRALDERLDEEVLSAHRTGHPFVVVMMDLDGFKDVNDAYGHPAGDQVLRVLFNYLTQGLRTSDFLARYGGDELTLVLNQTDLLSANLVTEKMLEELQNFNYTLPDGKRLKIGMSGGIALFPIHGQTSAQLLRAADAALYTAKKHQRGNFLVAKAPTGLIG